MANNIIWSPVGPRIVHRLKEKHSIRLIIAPFIQRVAIRNLLDSIGSCDDVKVVTRWNSQDITSGVSDVEVFSECQDRGISMYVHSRIHLKLLVATGNQSFVSSANMTKSGYGYGNHPNIEAGVWVENTIDDWINIYSLLEGSIRVTEEIYHKALEFKDNNKDSINIANQLIIEDNNTYSLASLPASSHPTNLRILESDSSLESIPNIEELMHDVSVYYGSSPTAGADIVDLIESGFLSTKFIVDFVHLLKSKGSLCFGEATAWVHSNCSDIPLPFRSIIKTSVGNLYRWLEYYVDEISVSIPGRRSEVIYWKSRSKR